MESKKYVDFDKVITTYKTFGHLNLHNALEAFNEIPAANVRPVVHGTWQQTGGKYSRHKTIDRRILTCSVCGNSLYMEGVNAGRGDANFCPNCGADMREIINE